MACYRKYSFPVSWHTVPRTGTIIFISTLLLAHFLYRWDIQRARSLFEHEELLRKYQLKSAGGQTQEKKKEKCTTLLPKVSESKSMHEPIFSSVYMYLQYSSLYVSVEAIEVMDTVVVSAFGRPIPLLNPRYMTYPQNLATLYHGVFRSCLSEFELPWFDLDVREAKESVRTTRSRAKATKTSTADSSGY